MAGVGNRAAVLTLARLANYGLMLVSPVILVRLLTVAQFGRYMGHVLKNVGGVYETFHSVEQAGAVYEPAPKMRQHEAIVFFNNRLFETPHWLLDTAILNRISSPSAGDPIGSIQTGVLGSLLSSSRLNTLLQSADRYGDTRVYTVEDLLQDIRKGIWKELDTHQPVDVYRRNLQKTYVESLISIVNPATAPLGGPGLILFFGPNTRNTDLPSIAKAELFSLRSHILITLPAITDRMTKYHLQDLADRIRKALDPKG